MRNLDDWLEEIESRHPSAIDLGLERIKTVAARLNLDDWTTPIVVIGGTNGKGSTVAMLESLALSSGLHVGTYTSPHLFHFSERIKIDGQPLAHRQLSEGLDVVEAARCQLPTVSLTYFEMTTLLALHLFQQRQQNLDLIVLEVGLGGRLDAVNIVDADVAVITSIGLDHQAYLGDTLSAIGTEKVAIARAGKLLVLAEAEMPPEVNRGAAELGAIVQQVDSDYWIKENESSWSLTASSLELTAMPLPSIKVSNAAAALVAFEHIFPEKLTEQRVVDACRGVAVAGRFSQIEGWPNIYFDVAHNPAACTLLANRVARLKTAGKIYALCGFLADKAVSDCIAPFSGLVSAWYCAPVATNRTMPGAELVTRIGNDARLFDSLEEALVAVRQVLTLSDTLIVFGSFYTVSEVQGLLCNNK